jgi:hypothetical protein
MKYGRIFKGLNAVSNAVAKTIPLVESSRPSLVHEDEILDWDVPTIDAPFPSDKIRVRVRDAEAEPMLDV